VLALTCGHALHTTQHVCCKTLTCAANYSQILAADQAGLDFMQSALKSCVVNKPEDDTTKCKIDKALQRGDLEKSTATAEPITSTATAEPISEVPPPQQIAAFPKTTRMSWV
jgi:hypothetical protein